MAHPFDNALVIAGPTASGKSALAVALAQALDGEVIGADSQQLYEDLPRTTCQPTAAERAGIAHHLIGVLPAQVRLSAAEFGAQARSAAAAIAARGKRVLLVGGTGLYLRAALEGLFEGPAADPELRAALQAEAARDGATALHARLQAVDPEAAARLSPNDLVRVVRALEIQQLTGVSQTEHHRRHAASEAPRPANLRWFAIALSRDALYARIALRTAALFPAILEEAEALRARGLDDSPAARALGIPEALRALRGELSPADAEALTVTATRRYAKRQLTWFRAVSVIRWLPAGAPQALAAELGACA